MKWRNNLVIFLFAVVCFLFHGCSNREKKLVIELQGNIEIREVRLGFEVPGRISHLYVDEGDSVKEGDLLAQLKPEYFEDEVRQAEGALKAAAADLLKLENGSRPEEIRVAIADLEAAQAAATNADKDFVRAKALFEDGVISQSNFDNFESIRDKTKANLKAAREKLNLAEAGFRSEEIESGRGAMQKAMATLEEAKRRLSDSKLIAPINGIIQTRIHEAGDYIASGDPVFTISITEPVWVRAYINERELGRIKPGMDATVKTDDGKTYNGRLGFISTVAEFTPKTVQTKTIRTDLVYRVRIIVSNSSGELRQGMPVTVYINLK